MSCFFLNNCFLITSMLSSHPCDFSHTAKSCNSTLQSFSLTHLLYFSHLHSLGRRAPFETPYLLLSNCSTFPAYIIIIFIFLVFVHTQHLKDFFLLKLQDGVISDPAVTCLAMWPEAGPRSLSLCPKTRNTYNASSSFGCHEENSVPISAHKQTKKGVPICAKTFSEHETMLNQNPWLL